MIGVNVYHLSHLHTIQWNNDQWETPFFLMYHRDLRIPLYNLLAHRVLTYAKDIKPHDSFAINFQLAWPNKRDNLQQQQLRQKQQYDKTARPSKITTGNKVVIRRSQNKPGLSSKLTYQFEGPYRCIRIEGNHLFLTPTNKPNAEPSLWHIDHVKLFHAAIELNAMSTSMIMSEPRKWQGTENKNSIPY